MIYRYSSTYLYINHSVYIKRRFRLHTCFLSKDPPCVDGAAVVSLTFYLKHQQYLLCGRLHHALTSPFFSSLSLPPSLASHIRLHCIILQKRTRTCCTHLVQTSSTCNTTTFPLLPRTYKTCRTPCLNGSKRLSARRLPPWCR